ncbi:hypothetical protein FDP41_003987 [Naegleria fowleri]|uniref:Uncharacterized protein n=1 Tax=Naegleria fowleri TaxID=5763 RepID=A0A6A5BPG5_NAEFO|nr:uncharacterized protein FDP41_003987 [Naegleria fowleri]KAF0976692.1 hypothetical protein FDP41_003987 [Naegleria fowleri]
MKKNTSPFSSSNSNNHKHSSSSKKDSPRKQSSSNQTAISVVCLSVNILLNPKIHILAGNSSTANTLLYFHPSSVGSSSGKHASFNNNNNPFGSGSPQSTGSSSSSSNGGQVNNNNFLNVTSPGSHYSMTIQDRECYSQDFYHWSQQSMNGYCECLSECSENSTQALVYDSSSGILFPPSTATNSERTSSASASGALNDQQAMRTGSTSLNSSSSSLFGSSNSSFMPNPNNTNGKCQDEPLKSTSQLSEEMQLQWIDYMKNRFLTFVEDTAKLASEMEIKMMFVELFYDPVLEKVPSKVFKTVEDVYIRLDVFCRALVHLKLPFEIVEFEKLRNEALQKHGNSYQWFYLKYLPSLLKKQQLFKHEYLKDFLEEQMIKCEQPRLVLLNSDDVAVSNSSNISSNPSPRSSIPHHSNDCSSQTAGLLDEIKLLCHMFLIELGDWFSLFEYKQRKKMKKWFERGIKNHCIPKYVLEIYKKKKEKNEKAFREFKFKDEDLNIKHVIDSDWTFTNWMCHEHTNDWYVTYSNMPNVIQWNSDEDHSVGNLELRNSKIIGYLDHPLGQVVKSTHYDSHLEYCFKNVEWHYYTPINASSSTQKYPGALMTAKFDFGPMFSLRGVQFVFSSKSQFLGDKMVENAFLFKSSDFVKTEEIKDLIKCPFVGSRISMMVDKNRTRYVEARTSNLGGFLNKKIIFTNPLSAKKLCLDNYHGILKAIREAKEKGYAMPSFANNYLAKILYDYCKYYCGVDLQKNELE